MKTNVTITLLGGGTGQSNILRGLKKFNSNLNSIVTMADDGGSSGMLRKDMNVLPPGDLRNCILALSNIEPDMEKLFQYRFTQGSLKGQNFGNLFLVAMNNIHGDLKKAIAHTSKILAVRGNVYPVTYENINLSARLKNGNTVKGESNLSSECIRQNTTIDRLFVEPDDASASDDAIQAIRESDVIIVGPGSLYTSILPVLLVKNIKEEIKKSKALKIFITNIMTEAGETDNFTSKGFVSEIIEYLDDNIFDYFIINTGDIPPDVLQKYKDKSQVQISFDNEEKEDFLSSDIKFVENNLVKIKDGLIFHDADMVSNIIKELFEKTNKSSIYERL